MKGARKNGFTLIELVVTMVVGSIVGLLMTFNFVTAARLQMAVRDKIEAVREARIATHQLVRALSITGWILIDQNQDPNQFNFSIRPVVNSGISLTTPPTWQYWYYWCNANYPDANDPNPWNPYEANTIVMVPLGPGWGRPEQYITISNHVSFMRVQEDEDWAILQLTFDVNGQAVPVQTRVRMRFGERVAGPWRD